MSDGKKMNEPIDHFSEYFRKRLADHPTPPDEMCWDAIEMRMPQKRRISSVWIGLAVAASVLVAVFLWNRTLTEYAYPDRIAEIENHPVSEVDKSEMVLQQEVQQVIVQEDITRKEVVPDTVSEHPGRELVAKTNPVRSTSKGTETTLHKVEEKKDSKADLAVLPIESVELSEYPVVASSEEPIASSEEPIVERQEPIVEPKEGMVEEADACAPPVDRKYADRRPIGRDENRMAYNPPSDRRSGNNNGWQVSAGFASGGSINTLTSSDLAYEASPGEDINNPDYGKDPTDPGATDPGDGTGTGTDPDPGVTEPGEGDGESTGNVPIPEDDIMDMTHSVPVSFGLTVRKMLNRTVGIESGLIYTYLSTDFEMRGANRYDASLKMHYLGIPVNLIVNLNDRKPWNIYVSGGGMVEKGIYFAYKQSSYFSTGAQGKETGSVSGLQWSLNGSFGFSYNLYKGMNLYAEPGFSYYFDTAQPISRRTDNPFNFNLRIGIRYDF